LGFNPINGDKMWIGKEGVLIENGLKKPFFDFRG